MAHFKKDEKLCPAPHRATKRLFGSPMLLRAQKHKSVFSLVFTVYLPSAIKNMRQAQGNYMLYMIEMTT
jgi:hypothetical protein